MLNQTLFSAEQVRDNEALAAKNSHCDLFTLMERAGEAVYKEWQLFDAKHALVLAGHGNNAGDGYVVARLIMQSGKSVTVCAAEPNRVNR